MRTVACPFCGTPVLVDNFLAGGPVACDHCGKRFEVPPPASDIPPNSPGTPGIDLGFARSIRTAKSRRPRSRLKATMIVLSISLMPALLLIYFAGRQSIESAADHLGNGWARVYYVNGGVDLIHEEELDTIATEKGETWAVRLLIGYFIVNGVLAIVWFASRPD